MAEEMTEDERTMLAAELVLGLLEQSERSDALEKLAIDPAFAAEVRRWEALLAPLFAGYDHREPPRDLYPEIRERLDRIDELRRHRGAVGRAANENQPERVASGWRWATFGSAAVAAALAVALLTSQTRQAASLDPSARQPEVAASQPTAQNIFVAQLAGEDGSPRLVASAQEGQPTLRVRIISTEVSADEPAGSVPVLWVIAGDNAPRALGTLPRADGGGSEVVSQISLRQALRDLIDSGATLAITYEPATAQTYDAPTTPIVASGTVSEL